VTGIHKELENGTESSLVQNRSKPIDPNNCAKGSFYDEMKMCGWGLQVGSSTKWRSRNTNNPQRLYTKPYPKSRKEFVPSRG